MTVAEIGYLMPVIGAYTTLMFALVWVDWANRRSFRAVPAGSVLIKDGTRPARVRRPAA
jgi:hypothetical protein